MTTARELAAQMLRRHEGRDGQPVLTVYDDATGKRVVAGYTLIGHPTIGFGRNLAGFGVLRSEAEVMLERDIDQAIHDCIEWLGFQCWGKLSVARHAVLINMAFNLGLPRLRKFKNLRIMLLNDKHELAADEMLASKWAKQVGGRAQELAKIMRTGEMS